MGSQYCTDVQFLLCVIWEL